MNLRHVLGITLATAAFAIPALPFRPQPGQSAAA